MRCDAPPSDASPDIPLARRVAPPSERHLLADVPQEAGGVEAKKAVVDGHLVERGALFVAKERIRNPDLVPAVLAESDLRDPVLDRFELKARVEPLLPQVHAHRVVLGE